jgi:hypothetical protein
VTNKLDNRRFLIHKAASSLVVASMYSADVARKRAEAAEFQQVARMVSLQTDREWCLRRAECLEREAEELERLASNVRIPAQTVS